MIYQYRNLRSNIAPANSIWCVSGVDHNPQLGKAGVLEWCYNEEDAKNRLALMQPYPQFSNLSAERWIANHELIHAKAKILA